MSSAKRKILVTGSSGQIGSELVPALRERYGTQNVVACDIKPLQEGSGPFELADVTDREALEGIIRKHRIGSIYHLVSILSAAGEMNPNLAWSVNIESLRNVLDLALQHKMEQIFWPSSIAAFGPHTPRIHTHQLTVMDPNTMYGITKVTGELLCNYNFVRYGLMCGVSGIPASSAGRRLPAAAQPIMRWRFSTVHYAKAATSALSLRIPSFP